MYCSILNFIAKSLILDQLDIVKPPLQDQQKQLPTIMLLQNCLACARCVVNSTVMDLTMDRMSSIEPKRWKRTCMLLVAFIMQYVSPQVTWLAHRGMTCIDILWYYSFSREERLEHPPTLHKGSTPGPARRSNNGRFHVGSHSEMLEIQPFWTSHDEKNSESVDSSFKQCRLECSPYDALIVSITGLAWLSLGFPFLQALLGVNKLFNGKINYHQGSP